MTVSPKETLIKIRLKPTQNPILPVWEKHIDNPKKLKFLLTYIQKAIESCLSKTYSDFDAHITSNCCHGISLFVSEIVRAAFHIDLPRLQQAINQMIDQLPHHNHDTIKSTLATISPTLLHLAGLYVLHCAREINDRLEVRTKIQPLKIGTDIGSNFCWKIVNALQRYYSNLTVSNYQKYSQSIDSTIFQNGAPLKLWSRYIDTPYIRVDQRKIKYASCIYSTQICLAYLMQTKARVAVLNNIVNDKNELIARETRLLRGNGGNGFIPLSQNEIELLEPREMYEPVTIFEGCTRLTNTTLKHHNAKLSLHLPNLSSLILSCDTHYFQFPRVKNDPNFDDSPIVPQELELQNAFIKHERLPGVSSNNPFLFCLTHIRTASMQQLRKINQQPYSLPIFLILSRLTLCNEDT